jgi:hypothetical protein
MGVKINEFSVSILFLFIFSFLSRCYSAKMKVHFITQTTYMERFENVSLKNFSIFFSCTFKHPR